MKVTAILSIFSQDESYLFALDLPHQSPLYPQQIIHASSSIGGRTTLNAELRAQLNKNITDVVTQLRREYVPEADMSNGHSPASQSLERLGKFLFNYVLPPTLQEALRELPFKMPIVLASNDVGIPWELLHDGSQYLAMKYPIGRRLWSEATAHREAIPEPNHRSFLFIANPTEDLPEADIEVEELMDLFEPELIAGADAEFLARSRATKWEVLQALGQEYDLIHYSGHAEASSLLLADGQLTTEEIQKTLKGQPFVFLNACLSVRQAKSSDLSDTASYPVLMIRSLAEAFIMGGAVGFIGTLWQVFDKSSREFAEWFYTLLRKGVPVGEALRQARVQMYETRHGDPIWASFVLYGDPMLKIISAPAESQVRHVTVLVVHLEGFFPLFEALELEEAAQIRDEAINLLREVAESHHGHFYASMGDLLIVHFGVPKAYGNDTEHAIQVALKMSRALHLFHQQEQKGLPMRLGVRVGISTRRVLVRTVMTSNGANYEIIGDVEGIATSLATHAEVNQVLVDEHSQQVARDKFAFDALPPFVMTAGWRPITPYRVIDHTVHPPLTAIVGREDKLNDLRKQWRKVKRGRGQVVGIEGDAGVGKTRLVAAFREQLNEYNQQWIRAICHTYEEKQSYSLLAQVIRQLAGIEGHDSEKNQRQKISHLVLEALIDSQQSTQGMLEDRIVLLEDVVGRPIRASAVNNLDPAQRQKILERVVVDILKSKATSVPIVLVLEDLQWADQATLAVLDQVIRQVRQMPLLLLAVYRSDWGWPHENGRHKWIQPLHLEELEEDERGTLLEHLLGTVPSEELVQVILEQTGGNPLFVKEYVRLLQENGALIPLIRADNGWLLAANPSQIPHFGKIEQVIQARIDQLTSSSRQVMQKGAVIGATFEEDVLEAVQDRVEKKTLEQDIEQLTERRLIDELGGNPYSYAFYHGLIHESVYRQLSEKDRQTVHKRVANALRELYGNETDIYRLAYHYYHSNDRVNAIAYCLQVAKRDADKWANQTAVDWYDRALEKIQSFDERPPTEKEETEGATPAQIIEWQVEALEDQADVQSTIGQIDQAIVGYERALELVATSQLFPVTRLADLYRKVALTHHNKGEFDITQEMLNKGLQALDELECLEAGRIYVHIGLIHWKHGRLIDSLASCEQGIAIIKNTDNIRDLAQAYNLQGILCRRLKDSNKAIAAYNQSINLYEQAKYIPGLERASYNLACVYKDQGKWKDALLIFEKCKSWTQQTGEVLRQVAVLNGQAEIHLRQGQLDQAITNYSKAQQITQEFGIEEFEGVALMNLGASCLKKGQLTEARAHLRKSLDIFLRREANQRLPELLPHLAELEIHAQQPHKALQYAQDAIDWVLKLDYKQQKGQAERSLGQAYYALGQLDQATTHLSESLKTLEERNLPYQIGLTLLELALLPKTQFDLGKDQNRLRAQAMAHCDRAMAIFDHLGAALDLEQAQQIRQSL